MKVAITSQQDNLDALVDIRFGRCPYFVIVDLETRNLEVVPNPALDAMGGAGPQAAQAVVDKGIEAVITGNVGPNAFKTLKAAKIKVYQVSSGTVGETLEKYEIGQLNELSNSSVPGHYGSRKGGEN